MEVCLHRNVELGRFIMEISLDCTQNHFLMYILGVLSSDFYGI